MTDPAVMVVMWLVVFGFELGTFIDIDWYILPDGVTIGGMVLGLAVSPLLPQLHGTDDWLLALLRSVIGLCTGFGILYLVAVLGKLAYKKEAMGFGDVKLMGALGIFFGLSNIIVITLMSFLIGAVIVSFPTVTSVMMYNYVADGYGIAFFLSVLAAYYMTKEKPEYWLSALLIAFSTDGKPAFSYPQSNVIYSFFSSVGPT